MPFLFHNLEDAQLRKVAIACGESDFLMVFQKLNCFVEHLAYHFSSSCRMTPSVMGLSASDGALADGEDLTVHLILTFALQDNVKFLVSLVSVQETAVLTRNERLE